MSQIRLFFLEPMINQFSKKRRTVFSDNNKQKNFFSSGPKLVLQMDSVNAFWYMSVHAKVNFIVFAIG